MLIALEPLVATLPLRGTYSIAPTVGDVWGNPFAVRNRPISRSGFTPLSVRRTILRIARLPNAIDVFDCSAPMTVGSSAPAPPGVGFETRVRNAGVGFPISSPREPLIRRRFSTSCRSAFENRGSHRAS
jgi:hypothetical protein